MKKYWLLVLLALPCTVSAKILYVDNSGSPACSDSTTYAANSSSSPWCTIGRAAWGSTDRGSPNSSQAAVAGDVVLISAGIYDVNISSGITGRFTSAYNPANSGTSGSPITFRGVGSVYPRISGSYRGGTIGCNSRNYIIWDNFQIEDYYLPSTSDTGPVVFSGAVGCQIINSTVVGVGGYSSYRNGTTPFGGNYRGVSIEPATYIRVANNTIRGIRPGNVTPGQNECGVMTYDAGYSIIENNEIYDSGCGIFIKGDHDPVDQVFNTIRYNVVRDAASGGIRALGAEDTKIYQNIVINSSCALHAGFGTSARSQFVNNTVYGGARGFCPQGTDLIDVTVLNNIFSNVTDALYNWTVSLPSQQDVTYNRNLYYSINRVWQSEGGVSFATASEFYAGTGQEANGLQDNPLFVNAAARDFHLQAGSPARTLGRTITAIHGTSGVTIPAGAYITGDEVIGIDSGGGGTQTLRAPTNLRIR